MGELRDDVEKSVAQGDYEHWKDHELYGYYKMTGERIPKGQKGMDDETRVRFNAALDYGKAQGDKSLSEDLNEGLQEAGFKTRQHTDEAGVRHTEVEGKK